MQAIRDAICEILERDNPMTVRGLFYRLVAQALIAKTENEYKTTVVRLIKELRLNGAVPFEWIADSTRWMRKPTTFSDLNVALHYAALTYRRSVWNEQDVYVEVWTEKDAVAGILAEVTRKWDVPLMVSRGFSSISFLHSAAETIQEQGKPAFLYYFGDHDPSGVNISQVVERQLREFAPEADFTFERVAVTPEQIEELDLPMRPTKKSDPRSKNFDGGSVELDAIESQMLRRLCEECITSHIDNALYEKLLRTEKVERNTLEKLEDKWVKGRPA
jgi:hypothetical protein